MATQPSTPSITSTQALAKTVQRERRPDKGWRAGRFRCERVVIKCIAWEAAQGRLPGNTVIWNN